MAETRPIAFPPDDELDDDMVAVLRSMSGAERLQIAFKMIDSARSMLTHHLRSEHPEWSDEAVQREVARRISQGDISPARTYPTTDDILDAIRESRERQP